MGRKRKDFSDKFKIEVAREALEKRAKEAEVAAKYNIAPSTLSEWMELFLEGKLETDEQKALREENEKLRAKQDEMLAFLGKKQLEVDLLKKKATSGLASWQLVQKDMRDENGVRLTILEQCRILKLSRTTYYECCKFEAERQKKKAKENKIRLKRAKLVINEWSTHSTYGYKKMSKHLKRLGYDWAGEKLIRNLYKELGIKGQKPVFKTTRSGKAPYGKFPYLLRNKFIAFPNQVMATDITYIKTSWGMMYFTAVIDLYSRKILSWRLSDSMKTDFCLECVREAFEKYGVPAVFNTDCSSQYTSGKFIELLKSYNVEISMDGIGRCKDNIFVERTWRTLKYEWIFLRDYRSEEELRKLLGDFVKFFNNERIHQGLDYKTPDEVYREGSFPSAIIKKMAA